MPKKPSNLFKKTVSELAKQLDLPKKEIYRLLVEQPIADASKEAPPKCCPTTMPEGEHDPNRYIHRAFAQGKWGEFNRPDIYFRIPRGMRILCTAPGPGCPRGFKQISQKDVIDDYLFREVQKKIIIMFINMFKIEQPPETPEETMRRKRVQKSHDKRMRSIPPRIRPGFELDIDPRPEPFEWKRDTSSTGKTKTAGPSQPPMARVPRGIQNQSNRPPPPARPKVVPIASTPREVDRLLKSWYKMFGKKVSLAKKKYSKTGLVGQTTTWHEYGRVTPTGRFEKSATLYLDDATQLMVKALKEAAKKHIKVYEDSKHVAPGPRTAQQVGSKPSPDAPRRSVLGRSTSAPVAWLGDWARFETTIKLAEQDLSALLLLTKVYPDLSDHAMNIWFSYFAPTKAPRWMHPVTELGMAGNLIDDEHRGRKRISRVGPGYINFGKRRSKYNRWDERGESADQAWSGGYLPVIRDESDHEWAIHENPHKEWNVYMWRASDHRILHPGAYSPIKDKIGREGISSGDFRQRLDERAIPGLKRSRATAAAQGAHVLPLVSDGQGGLYPGEEGSYGRSFAVFTIVNPFTRTMMNPDQFQELLKYLNAHGWSAEDIRQKKMLGTAQEDRWTRQVYKGIFLAEYFQKGRPTHPELVEIFSNYSSHITMLDINRRFQAIPGVKLAYGPCADIMELLSDIYGLRMGTTGHLQKLSSCPEKVKEAMLAYKSWVGQNEECKKMFDQPSTTELSEELLKRLRTTQAATQRMVEQLYAKITRTEVDYNFATIISAVGNLDAAAAEMNRLQVNDATQKSIFNAAHIKEKDLMRVRSAITQVIGEEVWDPLWKQLVELEKTPGSNFSMQCLTSPFIHQVGRRHVWTKGLERELEREFQNLRKRNPVINVIKAVITQQIAFKLLGWAFMLIGWAVKSIWKILPTARLESYYTRLKDYAALSPRGVDLQSVKLSMTVALRAMRYNKFLVSKLGSTPMAELAVSLAVRAAAYGPPAMLRMTGAILRKTAFRTIVPGLPSLGTTVGIVLALRALEIDDDVKMFVLGWAIDPMIDPEGYDRTMQGIAGEKKKEHWWGPTPAYGASIAKDAKSEESTPIKAIKLAGENATNMDEFSRNIYKKQLEGHDAMKVSMMEAISKSLTGVERIPEREKPAGWDAAFHSVLSFAAWGADLTFIDEKGRTRPYYLIDYLRDLGEIGGDEWRASRSGRAHEWTEFKKAAVKQGTTRGRPMKPKKKKRIPENVQRKKKNDTIKVKIGNYSKDK